MRSKVLAKNSSFLDFRPVADGKRAHEKIAQQLKHAIFEKRIQPGDKLPAERELAEIFHTSRVTIRSAILTLQNAGLVHIKKGTGGGTFVAQDIGAAEVSELLRDIIQWKNISIHHVIEVRGIIEPQVAYNAAENATDEDIRNIWATIRELEHFFKVKMKFQSSDENFHRALADAAKNPLLSVFQAALIDILFRFVYDVNWKKEHKKSILLHHTNIAEKVEKKDPEAAMQAMIEHLKDMQRILSQCPVKKELGWISL
jgi:GntR family transcriptional repressor for pyruvate dehydrogenase complex